MLTLSTAFSAEQTFAPPSDESYRLGWWLNVDNLWRISEENYSYKCMGSKHPWLIFYILKKKENRRNYTANIISVFSLQPHIIGIMILYFLVKRCFLFYKFPPHFCTTYCVRFRMPLWFCLSLYVCEVDNLLSIIIIIYDIIATLWHNMSVICSSQICFHCENSSTTNINVYKILFFYIRKLSPIFHERDPQCLTFLWKYFSK